MQNKGLEWNPAALRTCFLILLMMLFPLYVLSEALVMLLHEYSTPETLSYIQPLIHCFDRQTSVTGRRQKTLSTQSEHTLKETQSLSKLLHLNFYPKLHALLFQIFSITDSVIYVTTEIKDKKNQKTFITWKHDGPMTFLKCNPQINTILPYLSPLYTAAPKGFLLSSE